jgi:hypothetical protein
MPRTLKELYSPSVVDMLPRTAAARAEFAHSFAVLNGAAHGISDAGNELPTLNARCCLLCAGNVREMAKRFWRAYAWREGIK